MLPCRLAAQALRRFFGTITHVATRERVAALTFDDGPSSVFTPPLLDLLRRYNARATFFLVGLAAQRHAELVEAMAAAGHAFGVHSWDHRPFPGLSSGERRRQLRMCHTVVRPYGTRLFRPPYGLQTFASHMDAILCGFRVVTWNLDVGDWCEANPDQMTRDALQRIAPGSILVFHDAIFRATHPQVRPDRNAMLNALERFLEQLNNSYRFVTVPELMKLGRPVRRNWYVRHHADWTGLQARW